MINKITQKFITVSAIAAPKLNSFSIQSNGEYIHVYDACIIRLLPQIFQVPYEIILPYEGENGVKLPDGNWTGLMGMVYRSEVDLAVGVRLTDPRFEAVHFSYPYHFSDSTFMTDKSKPDTTSLAIIHPFPLILWILFITAIILVSCVLLFHVYGKQTYENILFILFGSLLEKSIGMQLRKSSLKLIIGTWFIFVFVIINSYKAVLLSILTLPPLTGIRDIVDLAKAAELNSVTCYSYKNTALQQIFLQSEFVTWRSIGKCLQKNVIFSEDAETAFIKAPSKKAFITSKSYLKPYEEMYFISEDSFYNSMHAFSVSKQFCCQRYLNERIHRLFAAGFFQKIEKDEQLIIKLNATSSDSSEPGSHKILELENLKGAFILLFSGYVLSTIVLFIEIVVKHYYHKENVASIKKKNNVEEN